MPNTIEDINLEIDKDIMIPTPDYQEDIITDLPSTKVMRDKKGMFVKGTKNPRVSYHARNVNLVKLIEKKCGKGSEKLVTTLVKIATYNPEQLETYTDDAGNKKTRKKRYHFYNSQSQLTALTLLMKYVFGQPRKEIQVDKTVDVKIEKKVADLTKLINENHERLKVVK